MTASNEWGRVDADGTVFVTTAEGERAVGSWHAGSPEDGLAHFARRYDDLDTEIGLLESRLGSGAGDPKATLAQATALHASLGEAAVVGDLAALDTRLTALLGAAQAKLEQAGVARAAARVAAAAAKEKLVLEAEELSQSSQWKATGDRFRAVVEEWKAIRGVDRKADEQLWKRFAAARDAFTRRRGSHFAALDEQRGLARTRKEQLVAEAEGLSGSTDWGPTANRLKALMTEWKAAGRASKEAEEQLWTRFRAAQDAFFAARAATFSERDAEQLENQKVKEALIGEAEALDPAADLKGAQARLREIQERYDAAGHVPRDAIRTLDNRMRAAEQRVREAGDAEWKRGKVDSNPLLDQLRETVAKAETQLKKAQAGGNTTKIAEAEAAVAARREWLTEAERSVRR
ncbi:MAG TPA: DUF349 domain-containing protein [Mycobacteriales bacterium]|jgi:hypothetical protein|nr:DUF349 domain-containing protein [Mycobacteriales bacterium]